MKTKFILLIAIIIWAFAPAIAHEHHKHEVKKDSLTKTDSLKATADTTMQNEMEKEHSELEEHHEMEAINAFPNYHPLVVHFPIVLLLLALIFQLISFFVFSAKRRSPSILADSKELSWVTLGLLFFGVVTTWLSSNTFHAHPEELTGNAKEIFETHEQMADFTWWFSLAALTIKIISHFFLQRKMWIESIVALCLVGSAITVSIAGHHGAMLVHMEGIGPKGNHLETEEHEHQH